MSGPGGLAGPIPTGEDPDTYDRMRRRVLWMFPCGIYLLGASSGEEANLMTMNWAMQVSSEPKMLAIGVEAGALTYRLLHAAGAYAVSLIGRGEKAVARVFAKPAAHDAAAQTLAGIPYRPGRTTGAPVLADAPAWIECRVTQEVALGTHVLVLGEIVDAGARDSGEGVEILRMEDTRMHYGG